MIERHWKGLAKKEKANEYIAHLQNETFKLLEIIEGFVSARILKRELKDGIEFLIITEWQDIKAISKFAGSDPAIAVVPKVVEDMMVTYDDTVLHYEVSYNTTAA